MRPISREELVNQCRSGDPRHFYLRIPGSPRVYRDVKIVEVGDKDALLEAPDGSRIWLRLRAIFHPEEMARWVRRFVRREDKVDAHDVVDAIGSFLP